MTKKLPKCHVCGKTKKPYIVILSTSIIGYIKYQEARENGEIYERCWNYYCLTDEYKCPTDKEMQIAKDARKFAFDMLLWWEKDKKLILDATNDTNRSWDGTYRIAKWYRENEMKKK